MKTAIIRKRRNGREVCDYFAENLDATVIKDWGNLRRVNDIDLLFRWGSIQPLNSKYEINTVDMVERMNDKVGSRYTLQENNISVPRTYYSKSDINVSSVKYPVIGRKTYHSQGLGMVICNNPQEVASDNSSTYWSEYIKKDREFRIYVFFGRILGICEKFADDPNEISWNNSNGNAIFKTLKRKDFPIGVCKLALQTCKVLNVDFSAVDIIRKDTADYVLELNAAPSLSPYRQELFLRAFKWVKKIIEETGIKPNHFEFPEIPERNKHRAFIHPLMLESEV